MRRGQSLSLYSSAWLKLNFEEKEQPRTKSAIKKKKKKKKRKKKYIYINKNDIYQTIPWYTLYAVSFTYKKIWGV